MNNKPNETAAQPVIGPEEYDFSDVPESELKCCLFYEYMRESRTIIREVEKVRQQLLAWGKDKSVKDGDSISFPSTFTKVTEHEGGIWPD